MLAALLVLAVCSLGLWTVMEQMRENRRERAVHMEALMLAQQTMEELPANECPMREETVTGQGTMFRLKVDRQPLTEEWLWCQTTVTWFNGRGEKVVHLGKMVPTQPPETTP